MNRLELFCKKYSEQIRFMTIYYSIFFLVTLIICYCYYLFNSIDEEKNIIEQIAACPYSSFKLNDENRVACCKAAFVTNCGLTAAFCEGKVPMFLCQEHASCLSGPLCDTLPAWIKANTSEL